MGLKAAPLDQALLLDVHELDTRLQRLTNRVRALPEAAVLAELTAERETLSRTLVEQTGAWEDAVAELGRVEADVAVVAARIERDSVRLQSSSSVKDVHALEQELAALARRRDELEEIQLLLMERVDERETELADTKAAAAALETRIVEATERRDAALAEAERERREIAADREAVTGRVPGELLALYEKQRERYGVGASHLRGGVSSASGVALTATDLTHVRAAAPEDVLLCPDSNAILVRTEESGL